MAATSESQQLAGETQDEQALDPRVEALEKALVQAAHDKQKNFSRGRFAEEREWYELALFYQRRQWLSWNSSQQRWQLKRSDPNKPTPMPVTNHFAKTINSGANQLGAKPPAMLATPHDDSDQNRSAANAAELALPAIDRETGFKSLCPVLGKHTALWGVGVTKDFYDLSASSGAVSVPEVRSSLKLLLGCPDCGASHDLGELPEGQMPASMPAVPCPQCGSGATLPYAQQDVSAGGVSKFARGKLCTEVRSIFEIFLPRDAQDPNLAKEIVQKYRKPVGEAKRIWGEAAEDLKPDEKTEVNEIYLESLRSLVNYNHMHDGQDDAVTIVEYWADYDSLPKKVCEQIDDLVEAGVLDQQNFEGIEDAGIYVICAGDTALDWGINPLGAGKKPFTFFLWEKDPANVYNKGLGSDLIPIQKRLNRLDSLIELSIMTNASGKWLWPTTQTTNKPSGSPDEVIEYDPIGDGKIKPEFVQPSPVHGSVWPLRQSILMDFSQLGLSNGVQDGQANAGTPFRGMAYLGAKASEAYNTARALWEHAHQLRYEKLLVLAQKNWTEARQSAVAGFNGMRAMQTLMGSDLQGGYTLDYVADSSRPTTLGEKFELFGTLVQGGMIDPSDPATRDFVLDLANLEGVNLADHVQYQKAQRDLEKLKQGQSPQANQFMKFDVHLKYLASYIQTEEFESLDPQVQQAITMYAQALSMQMSMINVGGMGGPNPGQQLGAAIAGHGQQGHQGPLSLVPGQTGSAETAQDAAAKQGAVLGRQLP